MVDKARRQFLAGAAGAAALATIGLAGCSSDDGGGTTAGTGSTGSTAPGTTVPAPLPKPEDAPFDTVVVLMMENRSFDHMLGWFPGANGKQEGLSYVDQAGASIPTWHMAPLAGM
jgi:phospholipase C